MGVAYGGSRLLVPWGWQIGVLRSRLRGKTPLWRAISEIFQKFFANLSSVRGAVGAIWPRSNEGSPAQSSRRSEIRQERRLRRDEMRTTLKIFAAASALALSTIGHAGDAVGGPSIVSQPTDAGVDLDLSLIHI